LNIDDEIMKLIETVAKEQKIMPYVYNNNAEFIPHKTPIFYSGPVWDTNEVRSAIKALLVGEWLAAGENLQEFEKQFSHKINNLFGVFVNSGSSANLVMIAALKKYFGWKDGSEIIVSVVGFPTTISPIPQNGLTARFVDIEMDSLNFDLDLIEDKINKDTVAIFVSPVLGNPPDFDKLMFICEKHNLQLILDNCDSLGSTWRGKFLNEYAISSSNSFYAAHHISTIHGGMVVSNNRSIINLARGFSAWSRGCVCSGKENLLKNGICNKRFSKWLENYDGIVDHKYVFSNGFGYNLQGLDLQGAIGLEQLKKLDMIHEGRKLSKNTIGELIEKYIPNVRVPKELPFAEASWFGVPIICSSNELKQKLLNHFEKNLIQTRHYFSGNILLHSGFEKLDDYKKYPNANLVLDRIFFCGASCQYAPEIFDYIESVLKEFKNE
jgi:CDP-6-deoxy-D-xylo-4-hexulose-3-dehydrase